jgi:hypothetical protein
MTYAPSFMDVAIRNQYPGEVAAVNRARVAATRAAGGHSMMNVNETRRGASQMKDMIVYDAVQTFRRRVSRMAQQGAFTNDADDDR